MGGAERARKRPPPNTFYLIFHLDLERGCKFGNSILAFLSSIPECRGNSDQFSPVPNKDPRRARCPSMPCGVSGTDSNTGDVPEPGWQCHLWQSWCSCQAGPIPITVRQQCMGQPETLAATSSCLFMWFLGLPTRIPVNCGFVSPARL